MTAQSTNAPGLARSARAPQAGVSQDGDARLSAVLVLFLAAVTTPVFFSLGSLHLSPLRVILVVMVVPLFIDWVRTKGFGRFLATDFILIGFALWVFISLLVNHGLARFEFFGITTIEIIAPYLLARKYIRSSEHFRKFVKVLLVIMLFCIPAAILEATTTTQIYRPIFDLMGNVFPWRLDPRMGMFRAQVGFEHPILYGVFCASTFGLFYFTMRQGLVGKIQGVRLAIVSGVATFFSLSVGAFIGVIIQIYLIIWNRVMRQAKRKWLILGVLVVLAYVIVDVFSTRTPFEVFISYLTFNSDTSYWRILIFRFGIDDVWGSPLVGIGLNDWTRPSWMLSASVDNFWLLTAMRYGIPGFLFVFAAYISTLIYLGRVKDVSEEILNQRLGLAVVLVAMGVSMCTVHLWGASFVYFCFLLGTGAWMSSVTPQDDIPQGEAAPEPDARPYPYARSRRDLGLDGAAPVRENANIRPPDAPAHSRKLNVSGVYARTLQASDARARRESPHTRPPKPPGPERG